MSLKALVSLTVSSVFVRISKLLASARQGGLLANGSHDLMHKDDNVRTLSQSHRVPRYD